MSDVLNQIESGRQRRRGVTWQLPALILILLLAAFLRYWQLGSLPPGLYHDEAYNGLDALSLIQRDTFPIFYEGWELYSQEAHQNRPVQETRTPLFFEGNFGREPLHVYLMALSISLLGPTPFAIRSIPAFAGVLAVLTTYLAAKALLKRGEVERRNGLLSGVMNGDLIPLLAAFTMAVMYPNLTFSRFGVRAMLFVPLESLVVYCFWRGINAVTAKQRGEAPSEPLLQWPLAFRHLSPKWFIAAGFCLGLGLYTYATARLLPLLFVGYVFLWFWFDRRQLREQLANLVLMAATSLLVALPLLIYFSNYPYFFIFRSRYVANRGAGTFPGRPWLTWYYNIGRVFRGLFWQGETHLRHNLPGRPYLDPIQTALAVFGIVSMIGRRFDRRHLFLLLWLVVMLMPSILSGDAPHFGRMIGAGPPLSILVAMGAIWFGKQLIQWGRKRSPIWSGVAMFLILSMLIVSLVWAARDYFQLYATHPDLEQAFDVPDWQLGQYAASLPATTTVYLAPTQEEMATIFFAMNGQRSRIRSFYSPDNLTPVGQPGEPAEYLVRPLAASTLDRLESYFPAGTPGDSRPSFESFEVWAGAPRSSLNNPGDASWGGAIWLREWSAEQNDNQLVVSLAWQARVEMARSYTAFVHLLDEDGNLLAQLDRPPEGYLTSDWHPNEIVIDTYRIDLPADLSPGTYTLQTGFYYLPTLERLGEPVVLGQVEISR